MALTGIHTGNHSETRSEVLSVYILRYIHTSPLRAVSAECLVILLIRILSPDTLRIADGIRPLQQKNA